MAGSKQVPGCLVFAGDNTSQAVGFDATCCEPNTEMPSSNTRSGNGYFLFVRTLVSQVCDLCRCHALITKANEASFLLFGVSTPIPGSHMITETVHPSSYVHLDLTGVLFTPVKLPLVL